jgi:hypothetical protein
VPAKRYPGVDSHRRVTLQQIAGEIDRTPKQTAKLLDKTGFIGLKPRRGAPGRSITYDARALEVLKGLLGLNHRHVSDKADDWLSNWIGEQHYG